MKTLEEARKLDAAFIRDRYDEYTREHPAMFTVLDNRFCVGDPLVLYAKGECVDVAVMAGNPGFLDFLSHFLTFHHLQLVKFLLVLLQALIGQNVFLFLHSVIPFLLYIFIVKTLFS